MRSLKNKSVNFLFDTFQLTERHHIPEQVTEKLGLFFLMILEFTWVCTECRRRMWCTSLTVRANDGHDAAAAAAATFLMLHYHCVKLPIITIPPLKGAPLPALPVLPRHVRSFLLHALKLWQLLIAAAKQFDSCIALGTFRGRARSYLCSNTISVIRVLTQQSYSCCNTRSNIRVVTPEVIFLL